MPKQKTHKGTKKRFRLTGTGLAKFRHSGTGHLAFRKTQKRIRNLRGTTTTHPCEIARIRIALNGYSN
ncbi:MAG: 50S ribosomal protein L35 [Planctomycetia bacterium]|nr:50S ribosomal protein L35 [Planctomycetia bacterium]